MLVIVSFRNSFSKLVVKPRITVINCDYCWPGWNSNYIFFSSKWLEIYFWGCKINYMYWSVYKMLVLCIIDVNIYNVNYN